VKPEAARQAVALLTEAWQSGIRIKEAPASCAPKTPAEGYRVQDLLAKELGFEVGGWKVGATSPAARKLLRARGPFAGRIFAARMFPSGITLPATAYPLRGVEAEFAFVLAADLPARKRAYGPKEVAQAVGAVRVVIEVVDLRFESFPQPVPWMIADQGVNGCLVLGPKVARWQARDLAKAEARMLVNGEVVGQGTGAVVLGHPLKSLVWFANHRRTRGGLAKGQLISTGTLTGVFRAPPNAKVLADFGKLGKVELTFAE
jgi:2-keto-4-pentenoate hydratase